MLDLIWKIPLAFMGYVSLVAFTWQLAIWITPIDNKSFSKFVKHTGDAGSRFGLLLFFYPIVAPFQLMWAFRIRTDIWRERKALQDKRQDELGEIEHKTRVRELKQAEAELDRYLKEGPTT